MKLEESFFARDTKQVALDLLGKYLIRMLEDRAIWTRITSTEAYVGAKTRDKKGIYYAPGRIYMYPVRGHYNLNIATEAEGVPACVLVAEVECDGKRYGQFGLTKFLNIDKNFDGESITGEKLWIEDKIIIQSKRNVSSCVGKFSIP